MSGGHFNFTQFKIMYVWEEIQNLLEKQGTKKPKGDLWNDEEFYKDNQQELLYETYPIEIQEVFKKAVKVLKKAEVYTQRIDWFLSGEDGEESFLRRLKEELGKLENE